MVEEYQQALSAANLGGIRDVRGHYPQLSLKNLPQVPYFCIVYTKINRSQYKNYHNVNNLVKSHIFCEPFTTSI